MRNCWVKGVLEQSLHGAAIIQLNLEELPAAVQRPWDVLVRMPNQPQRRLPSRTRIIDLFEDMNQSLLILGEPGSGKTTMLLELARDAIAHAVADPTQPIPVVLNLSSWGQESESITQWLINELKGKYYVPKDTACHWVENNELLLLLDGLDEVEPQLRGRCVEAINGFRQKHGLTQLVICSRISDYQALSTRLTMQGAVLLQPLTPEQIEHYLESLGPAVASVRATLEMDPTLKELAASPLMLSIMTLAHKGISAQVLLSQDSTEARRRHILDAYVQQMLCRRGTDERFPPDKTVCWLTWLARKLLQHGETVFTVDQLQPTWLDSQDQRRLYSVTSCVGVAVLTGLTAGGSLGMFLHVLMEWFPRAIVTSLGAPIIVVGSPSDWLAAAVAFALRLALALGVAGLPIGVFTGLTRVRRSTSESVELIDALEWSWFKAYTEIRRRSRAWLLDLRTPGGLSDLGASTLHLAILVAGGLTTGLRSVVKDDPMDLRRGLRQSLKCAVVAGIGGALLGIGFSVPYMLWGNFEVIAAVAVLSQQSPEAARQLQMLTLADLSRQAGPLVAVLALVLALRSMLRFGGRAVLQNLSLRLVLHLNRRIPWRYAELLDFAVERILLRKVGRGYIFIHRLLLEHFASGPIDAGP